MVLTRAASSSAVAVPPVVVDLTGDGGADAKLEESDGAENCSDNNSIIRNSSRRRRRPGQESAGAASAAASITAEEYCALQGHKARRRRRSAPKAPRAAEQGGQEEQEEEEREEKDSDNDDSEGSPSPAKRGDSVVDSSSDAADDDDDDDDYEYGNDSSSDNDNSDSDSADDGKNVDRGGETTFDTGASAVRDDSIEKISAATKATPRPAFLPSKRPLQRRRSSDVVPGGEELLGLDGLLVLADSLLKHLNALWVLRCLGSPSGEKETALFMHHYGLDGVADGLRLVTDARDAHARLGKFVYDESMAFVRACSVDVRSPAHSRAKRRVEKLVSAAAADPDQQDATDNGGPRIVVKSGAYNTVTIAPSLDLCLRVTKSDAAPDADDIIPPYEDAIRELIGYCELAEVERIVLSEQIGGKHRCEEVAHACLLPLSIHLALDPDPSRLPVFESSWRALHGDLSGIIVKDNVPTDGFSAHDMHAHMSQLFLHAAVLFKNFGGRQQCDLNPRNLLLDWNGAMKKSDLGMYGTPRFMDAGTFGTLHPLQLFTDIGPTDFFQEWSGMMLDVFALTLVMMRLFDERSFGPLLDAYAEQQKHQRTATESEDSVGLSNSELIASLGALRAAVVEILEKKNDAALAGGETGEAKRLQQMKSFVAAVLSTEPKDWPTADDIIYGRGVAKFCACERKCDHSASKMKIVAQAMSNAVGSDDKQMISRLEELQASLTSSISHAESSLGAARRFRNKAQSADSRREDIFNELTQSMDRIFEISADLAHLAASSPEGDENHPQKVLERSEDLKRVRARCEDLREQLELTLEESDMWRYKQDKGVAHAVETLTRAREDAEDQFPTESEVAP